MLIAVLIENKQYQVHIFQYICFENSQTYLFVIMYCSAHADHDNNLDF